MVIFGKLYGFEVLTGWLTIGCRRIFSSSIFAGVHNFEMTARLVANH